MREARRCVYCSRKLDADAPPAQAFCSVRCRRAEAKLRASRRRVVQVLARPPVRTRPCAECGEIFAALRRTARFCSDLCRQRNHRVHFVMKIA